MRRLTIILTIFILVVSGFSIYGATGTPSNLVVRTDANNSLIVVGATQTSHITQGVFASRTLRTDANGNLQVIIGGGPISPTSASFPVSTCAAPAINMQGGTTTGIAFTATPSILNCISGTAVTTLTGSSFTSTVPILLTDGSDANPSLAFSSQTGTGLRYLANNTIKVMIAGAEAVRFNSGGVVADKFTLDITNQDVTFFREAANHYIQRNGANAQRASWANTYTSSTNYESFSIDWQTVSNVALVGTRTAATGTGRNLRIGSQVSNAGNIYAMEEFRTDTAPFWSVGISNAAGAFDGGTGNQTGNLFNVARFTSTSTSGQVTAFAITPTYNQASGNAANTDLLINRTQTAVGSGTQRLIDAQVGGVTKFSAANNGGIGVGVGAVDGQAGVTIVNGGFVYFDNASALRGSSNGRAELTTGDNSLGVQLNFGTAAPTVTSCGTGTVTTGSRNTAGEITATGATACTVTFGAPAWTNTPFCTVTLANAPTTTPYISASSTTAITVSGLTAGDVFKFHCIGRI